MAMGDGWFWFVLVIFITDARIQCRYGSAYRVICVAGVIVADNLCRLSGEQVGKIAFWALCVAVVVGAVAIYDIRSDASLSGLFRTDEARAKVSFGTPYSRGAAFLALLLFPCVVLSWRTVYRRVAIIVGGIACVV